MWIALGILALVLLALPRVGLVEVIRRWRRKVGREQIEDALKHLLELEYRGRRASFSSLQGTLRKSDAALMRLVDHMQRQGLLRAQDREFHLTPDGERVAIQVVRAHRLWERYLADEARLPLKRLHREAERHEHALSADDIDRLAASLGHPTTDPHGDPIPTREGYIAPAEGTPLTDWPIGTRSRIVHLEDEPPLAYAQIVAEGLRVGQRVRVLDTTSDRITLGDGQREYRLAPAVAANVFVTGVESADAQDPDVMPLSELPPGTDAEVVLLDEACQGFTRRRLLDLGFTPGTTISADLTTFAGDPRAYRVRGSLVALRADQASHIMVRVRKDSTSSAVGQTLKSGVSA